MKTLSFDAAFATTGYAVIGDSGEVERYGVIKTVIAAGDEVSVGQDHLERIKVLRQAVHREILAASFGKVVTNWGEVVQVVVERTDWSRGRANSRADWITETKAREALAIGFTTVAVACLELGIAPIILGPKEWRNELGVGQSKEATAEWCAANWPETFKIAVKDSTRTTRQNGNKIKRSTSKRVVVDMNGIVIPDHCTDALAMGWVARQAWKVESLQKEIF